jgi:drug/metabolite transporter (DMT)-like permease
MSPQRILGVVLLVVGIVLLLFGLNATDSLTEHVTEGLTGKYTDKTTWYILGGIALALVGGAMALIGGGRTRSA